MRGPSESLDSLDSIFDGVDRYNDPEDLGQSDEENSSIYSYISEKSRKGTKQKQVIKNKKDNNKKYNTTKEKIEHVRQLKKNKKRKFHIRPVYWNESLKQKPRRFPNMGSSHKDLNLLRKLSSTQLCYRKKLILQLIKDARKDRDKLLILRNACVGTISRTNWVWDDLRPYIRYHDLGYSYIFSKPKLKVFDQVLTQLGHTYSTYLLKVDTIQKRFFELERSRLASKYCAKLLSLIGSGPHLMESLKPSGEMPSCMGPYSGTTCTNG